MFTSLKRTIRYGWLNFRRQASFSIASIFVMFILLFLIASLFLFQGMVEFLTATLLEKVDVSVYFNQDLSEEEILKIKDDLTKISGVKDVEYVSREEALNRFTKRHQNDSGIMGSLAEVGGNPLLASLNIKAWDSQQYASIFNFLNNDSFKESIFKVDYLQRKPIIERLFSLTSKVNKAGILLSLVFAFVAVLLAFNQIRLAIYNSKKEIKIMRLVGAPNWLIRGPFLVQGFFIGISAVLLTLLIFVPACFFVSPKLETIIPGFNVFNYFLNNFYFIFGFQLVAGLGIGIFSSLIGLRKYLKA